MKHSNLNNIDLIKALSQGNPEAYGIIYDLYYESLCYYANRMLNDLDEAEDVVQNIILKLWENRETIVSIQNIKSYLFKSTYNGCLNLISKHGKKTLFENEAWFKLKELEMEERNSLEYSELNEIVNKLINELPDQCQRVFKMNRFEDKAYKEIAEELNISVKAVEGNISRALQKLKLGLKGYLTIFIIMFFK